MWPELSPDQDQTKFISSLKLDGHFHEIINWQKDGTVEVENYTHNHVLRSVITDSPLSSQESFVAGENIENSFPINLSDLEQANIDYSTNSAELGNGNAGGWNGVVPCGSIYSC